MTTLNPLPFYWIHYNNLIDKIIIDNSVQHFSDLRDFIKIKFNFKIPPQLIRLYYSSNQSQIKNPNSMVLLDPQNLIRNDGVLQFPSGSNIYIQFDNPIGQVNIFRNDQVPNDPNPILKPDYVFEEGVTWKEITDYLHLPKGYAIKRRNTPNNYFVKQPFSSGDYVLVKTLAEKKVYIKFKSIKF